MPDFGLKNNKTSPARTRAFKVLAVAGLGLLGTAVMTGLPHTAIAPNAAVAQPMNTAPLSFADLAEKVRPAVVSVYTKSGGSWRGVGGPGGPGGRGGPEFFNFDDLPPGHPLREFFEQFRRGPGLPGQPDEGNRPARAQGSGFLISRDGYVVTNNHVIDKAEEISVTFENEEKFDAELVGTDQRTDIALLKIKSTKQFDNYLEFANESPRVGDWVLAVGNPFGLGGTVTAGIVSAMSRDIGSGPYDYLQIDAAVNRGNSGGPAVNLKGQVVGVNTAIFSPSGGNVGIAFAVPADLARDVVAQLRQGGKVSRGWLGVTIQNISEDIAESLDLKEAKGALVTKILEDGPAAKSDINVGDVIVEVNGKQINDSRDLARTVAAMQPDVNTKVVVFRDGKRRDLTIKLGTFPSQDKLAALDPEEKEKEELNDLGLALAPASEVQGAGSKGVAIVEIDPNSEAAEKGLKKGDVIIEIGGEPVSSPSDITNGLRAAKERGKKAVFMQVRSKDQTRFIALSLASAKNADKDNKPN
ncbi:MAG: Do family serine endopeptidase [Hyphomicrobiales bacterium]|nr:Do family serine endopeptidase [Hyphomicrobiales bacterium]